MNESPIPSPFEDLLSSDDVFGTILLFLDFDSAVTVATGTSKALKHRSDNISHIWKEVFERHGFSPLEDDKKGNQDYVLACKQRRKLFFNLLQTKCQRNSKKKKKRFNCFNLPNRYFHFRPITPKNDDFIIMRDHDTPPIFYECDSFVLTSTATSPELVLLDPFDGSLTVEKNCLDQCMQVDDMMTMMETDENKDVSNNNNVNVVEKVESRASRYIQTLLGSDDYFYLDLRNYFPTRIPSMEEFDVEFVGTDSKIIMDQQCKQVVGNLIAVGRTVHSLSHPNLTCTELTAWTRSAGESHYDNRLVFRSPKTFRLVEIDAKHKRLFLSFQEDQRHQPQRAHQMVAVYPLVAWKDPGTECSNSNTNYFPDPLFTFRSKYPISSLALDVTCETLVMATQKNRALEVWTVKSNTAKQVQLLHCGSCLKQSIQDRMSRQRRQRKDSTSRYARTRVSAPYDSHIIHRLYSSTETNNAAAVDLHRQLSRLQGALIEGIYLPKHLPIAKGGFVTLQHSQAEGSFLLLWKQSDKGSFEVASLINLPLSSRRIPRIFYDGSKLIVFGQDHIGAIILIYQCASRDMPLSDVNEGEEQQGDSSGGVYNLTNPSSLRFVNRIRHIALGGIENDFDLIHMTCNERFIVVNTRTGHLLGSSESPGEGLLVIDLKDYE